MSWAKTLQSRLRVAADGIIGPQTLAALFRHMGADAAIAHDLGSAAEHLRYEGILDTPQRLTEFMGEMAHESGGFRTFSENLNYSSAARIRAVWPSRFANEAAAAPYVRSAEKLANRVYANRLGNGDEASGDGWRYRGRGIIQLTGRNNYREAGQRLGLPLLTNPELAAMPREAVRIAANWWRRHGLNSRADWGDNRQISGVINRGNPNLAAAGLADREARKRRVRALWA